MIERGGSGGGDSDTAVPGVDDQLSGSAAGEGTLEHGEVLAGDPDPTRDPQADGQRGHLGVLGGVGETGSRQCQTEHHRQRREDRHRQQQDLGRPARVLAETGEDRNNLEKCGQDDGQNQPRDDAAAFGSSRAQPFEEQVLPT